MNEEKYCLNIMEAILEIKEKENVQLSIKCKMDEFASGTLGDRRYCHYKYSNTKNEQTKKDRIAAYMQDFINTPDPICFDDYSGELEINIMRKNSKPYKDLNEYEVIYDLAVNRYTYTQDIKILILKTKESDEDLDLLESLTNVTDIESYESVLIVVDIGIAQSLKLGLNNSTVALKSNYKISTDISTESIYYLVSYSLNILFNESYMNGGNNEATKNFN